MFYGKTLETFIYGLNERGHEHKWVVQISKQIRYKQMVVVCIVS